MKFSRVVIADLKTMEECDNMVESIENDYLNCAGGISAWTSGYQTYLLTGAENKIEAIKRKNDRLWTKMIKAEYKKYLKENDFITFEEYEERELYC